MLGFAAVRGRFDAVDLGLLTIERGGRMSASNWDFARCPGCNEWESLQVDWENPREIQEWQVPGLQVRAICCGVEWAIESGSEPAARLDHVRELLSDWGTF